MRNIRLYVDLGLEPDAVVTLPASAAEHAVRVLRMNIGDPIVLFNGNGHDYHARLHTMEKRNVQARIELATCVDNESPFPLILAQAIARGDKMDWIVQKATELGVNAIVPLHTERSEVRLDAKRGEKRLAHWQAVAISACQQSGRARVPAIAPPQTLASWLNTGTHTDALRLALLPGPAQRMRDLEMTHAGALLAVGPEGGWGERDLDALRASRFHGLNLGPRVLRTETAGLAALAALQAVHGDF